jgi:hypothetical protein
MVVIVGITRERKGLNQMDNNYENEYNQGYELGYEEGYQAEDLSTEVPDQSGWSVGQCQAFNQGREDGEAQGASDC